MNDSKANHATQRVQFPPIPVETARAAQAIFGRDHLYMQVGRELERIWAGLHIPVDGRIEDELVDTFSVLAPATIFQYWEGLTNIEMSQALGSRLDLKYALHLPVTFPGFNPISLCRFRRALLFSRGARAVFDELLEALTGLAPAHKPGRTAGEVIGEICRLERAEHAFSGLHNALAAVADQCPKWLVSISLPHWFIRYQHKPGAKQIPHDPARLQGFIEGIGSDGQHLLDSIWKSGPEDCARLDQIVNLGREWGQQFEQRDGVFMLRPIDCTVCSRGIAS